MSVLPSLFSKSKTILKHKVYLKDTNGNNQLVNVIENKILLATATNRNPGQRFSNF